MEPVYEAWKADVQRLPPAEARFQRRLFVNLAGVLFGEKIGELIMLRDDHSPLDAWHRLRSIARLAQAWPFWFRLLWRGKSCLKVIIYDRSRAHDRLAAIPASIMVRMGYRPGVGPTEFLREIGRRWQASGRIPHEVGLLLGYPLKDVLGFMGLAPLRYYGGCGWRIYGNPCRSLRLSQRFRLARQQALAFIEGLPAPAVPT